MPPKRGRPPKVASKVTTSDKTRVTPTRTARKAALTPQTTKYAMHGDNDIQEAFRLFCIPRSDVEEGDEIVQGEEDDDDGEDDVIPVADVRKCINALGLPKPPAGLYPKTAAFVSWAAFFSLARALREDSDSSSDGDKGGEGLSSDNAGGFTKEDDEESAMPSAPVTSKATGSVAKRKKSKDVNLKDTAKLEAQQEEMDAAFALFTKNRASKNPSATAPANTITFADLRRVAKELREEVDDKTLRMMMEEANGESGLQAVQKGVCKADFESVMRRAGVLP